MEQRMRRNKLRWFKIEFLSCIFILTLATDGFCQASFTIFQQGALDKLYSYENITVKHYDISASIDMKKKSLKVHTKVLLKSKQENVKKLVFFLQSSIKINSIRHNNTQLRFGAKPFIPGIPYNIIRVFPNKPLAPGEEISLEFDCVGKNLEYEFQARDYLNKPIADFSRVLWYPLIFQEEFCTAHLTFHIPKGMTPVVDADLKQIMKGKNSTTYIYNTAQPIFSIGFMVGKIFTLKEKYNNIQCKVYYTIPAQKNIAKLFLSQSLKILSQYENWYGTYPFGIFQMVLVKAEITTPPFTNSRFIVITNPQEFLCNGNRELILTLAHEITHLWFPVQVSFKPKEGNWSEGIANDSAFMIWKKFCKRDYLKEMHEIAIGLRGDDRLEKPLKDVILPLTPIDIEVLYIKGAYFFQILRLIAGDSYFKIMRDFVEKYRYQFAGYSDIKSAFEGELGQNLDWFFEQWVETTKEFDFGIEKVDGIPAKDSFCFNIKNFGEILMPLKGEVVIKTENKIISKEFNLDKEIQEICINIDSPLVSIQLDPDYWFYDINREDNIWSRGKPLFKKGLSQIKEGDIKSAYQSLNRALQLDIDLIKEGQFLEAIAEVHSLEGKTDEFLENLKSIRDSSPDDAELTKILQEQVSSINIWQEKKHLKLF